jgi:hypothetical protein
VSPGGGGGGGGGGGKGARGLREPESQSTVAVTVKQLVNLAQAAPNDKFVLDGHPLTRVRVVGRLVEIEDDASTCKILLHDGTGTIQLTKYTEEGADWAVTRGTWM